jgi:hypothetical protein
MSRWRRDRRRRRSRVDRASRGWQGTAIAERLAMRNLLILSWLVGVCVAANACVASDDDATADRKGPIVCVAYPCCGDGVCDEGETCMLCPVDCGCDPNEICLDGAATGTVDDPGADAVCVANDDPSIKIKMQPER